MLVIAAALLLTSGHARAAPAIDRPPGGGLYGYAAGPVQRFAGAEVVVHWVGRGPDAPPLADADASGVPDYVEQMAAYGDLAVSTYRTLGFRRIRPDRAGGDARPDIYVKDLAGVLGVALAPAAARGGSFVMLAPDLDPSQAPTRGGLLVTTAHELFHLVQFAYLPRNDMPDWVAEGSATGLSLLFAQRNADPEVQRFLDRWFARPQTSLTSTALACAQCYGGGYWWYLLALDSGNPLPGYFTALAAASRAGRAGDGVAVLDRVLLRQYRRSLFALHQDLSVALWRDPASIFGRRPRPIRTLAAPMHPSIRTFQMPALNALATHYIRVAVPPGAGCVSTLVDAADTPDRPHIDLIRDGAPGDPPVHPTDISRKAGRVRAITGLVFRDDAERAAGVTLIVTSGDRGRRVAPYRVRLLAAPGGPLC